MKVDIRGPRNGEQIFSALRAGAGAVLLSVIVLLLAGSVPPVFGYDSFVVYSGSMAPSIQTGDIAVVAPAQPHELMVGQVITYRTGERPDVLVTHRLVGIGFDGQNRLSFQTKGDANDSVDQLVVPQGAVLGRVAYVIPKLGYLMDFAKRPEGKLVLIVLPGLVLALDWMLGRGQQRLSRSGRARATVARGLSLRYTGAGDGARYFDEAVALDPHLDEAWLLKAECLPSDPERLACLRAALTVNPNSQRLQKAVERASETRGAIGA